MVGDVEHAGRVLGALDLPSGPEQRLGVTGEHHRRALPIGEHPGVLAAAALARVHDEAPLAERHAGEPAGDHLHPVAAEHERPEVDVAAFEVVVDERGVPGQRHHLLRDVAPRVGLDPLAHRLALGVGGRRSDQHPVAARLGHRLHHQLVEAVEHVGPLVLVPQEVGGHAGEDRLGAEVVADELGHVGVHGLVVGHAVAHRVGDGDVAGPRRAHQPGHAEDRVAAEHDGVEEGVVDAAVDHVDALEAVRRAHRHHVVVHHEVAALDQLHAHLAGEEGVLEVGGVVHARREDDDGGLRVGAGRAHAPQRAEQRRAVVVDRADEVVVEDPREHAGHGGAVLEHVRHAARVAEVVLQHAVGALGVAHDVDAGHQAAGTVRHGDAERLALEAVAARDEPARDDPVVDGRLVAHVQVVEEPVEGGDPLDEPLLDVGPLVGRDDARHQVHRERPLDALALAVDGEGDAGLAEGGVAHPLPLGQLVGREPAEEVDQGLVVRARASRRSTMASSKNSPGS